MKKVCLMGILLAASGVLAAETPAFEEYLGESWYGLYLNGEKAGYLRSALEQKPDGRFVSIEEATFHITMSGIKQDMHIENRRVYGADGALEAIESRVVDPVGPTEFNAIVEGESMLFTSIINGVSSQKRLPRPQESLQDTLKHARWVREGPEIGDTLSFHVFEPMYERELEGISYILGEEERVFGGVKTRVYKIKTALNLVGIESVSYVTEDGTTLEDVVANLITMRLEPEEIAKDVDYNHDAIISNAAFVDRHIRNARSRDSLRLHVDGPLTPEHLFNDARQSLVVDGEKFLFEAQRLRPADIAVATLPVEDEELLHWTEATTFVQSDDPRIIAQAREIVGDETDALKISNLLSEWVSANMRSTFSARLTNALEVLESMEGDCTEHSILFIALARAAGLPAREVAGLVYVDDVQPGFYFHQWAKVWVGQWIDVDPTFNKNLAGVTHIKLAEGDLFRQARLIPLIGRLEITVLDDAPSAAAETAGHASSTEAS